MRKKFFIKLFLILFFSLGILLTDKTLLAVSIDELKNSINNQQNLIKKLDDEIIKYEQKIDVTRQQSSSLKKEIQQIDLTRQKLQTSLLSTQSKITLTNGNLDKLKIDIRTTEEKITDSKIVIAETLRKIRQTETGDLPEMLTSFNHLTDLWDDLSRYQSLNNTLNDHVATLRNSKQILEVDKNQTEQEKNKLTGLKEDLSDQKSAVDITKQTKDTLLTQTKSKESAYQKLLAGRKKKKQEVEAEIARVEAELQFALDPSKLPSTGPGSLGWPLLRHVITQGFGNTGFAKSSQGQSVYGGKGHNGIDLAASIGTQIYSSGSGQVVGMGDTDKVCSGASYGKWILIRHNNGLSTLYAHLSLIKVSTSQNVKRGEVIGLSGNTGYSTGPHLHFSTYASDGVKISSLKSKVAGCGTYILPIASYSAYLNPLNYL